MERAIHASWIVTSKQNYRRFLLGRSLGGSFRLRCCSNVKKCANTKGSTMVIAFVIGFVLLAIGMIYLAMLGKEVDRSPDYNGPSFIDPPESWKKKIVSVTFIKRDGSLRFMDNFHVLHVSRYKTGKVFIHGLEMTQDSWEPKGFCLDQILSLKVIDTPGEKEVAEAYCLYRVLSNPNNTN